MHKTRIKKELEKRKLLESRGITLIALVITIIVLLILAGVSIATLTGNNGILSQAQKASKETKIAEEKEQIGLAWNGATAVKQAQGAITASDIESQLSQNGVTNAEVSGDIVVKFEDEDGTSRWYKLENVGTITGPYDSEEEVPTAMTLIAMYNQAITDNCEGGEGCTNPEGHLHIGDYVNYQNPSSGSATAYAAQTGVEWNQTYNVDSNLKWRVLGLDEKTGNIKLIAETILKEEGATTYSIVVENSPYFDIGGAESYVYGPDEMDKIAELYYNEEYAEEARSIKIEDINEAVGMTDGNGNLDEEKVKQYNILVTMSKALQYGEKYGPFENQWTPEDWLKKDKPTSSVGSRPEDKITGYDYIIGSNAGISIQGEVNPPDFENLPMITIENQTLKSLLFDNTELGTGNSYWLASNGINALKDDNFAIFGPGIVASQDGMTIVGLGNDNFCSNGDERPYSGYIRPVVILKSNINKDQIQKVTE